MDNREPFQLPQHHHPIHFGKLLIEGDRPGCPKLPSDKVDQRVRESRARLDRQRDRVGMFDDEVGRGDEPGDDLVDRFPILPIDSLKDPCRLDQRGDRNESGIGGSQFVFENPGRKRGLMFIVLR